MRVPIILSLALAVRVKVGFAHVLLDEGFQLLEKRASCGSGVGSCPSGGCCSESGFCGTTEEYCAAPGCQLTYSSGCDTFKKPIGDSTENVARPSLGVYPMCTSPGQIALTYDDGPESFTSELLDKLDTLGVKATFFVSGNNVGKGEIDGCGNSWAAIVKRTYDSGHQIAHHTWTHQDLEAANSTIRKTEMIYNEMAFRNIFGWFPTYMRPPFLSCGSNCMSLMSQLGYHIISTNLDTKDYENDSPTLIQVSKNRYSSGVSNTSTSNSYIVLNHDTHEQTVTTLTDYMVQTAKDRGYKLVTVGECLGDPKENWYRSAGSGGACTPAGGAGNNTGGSSSSSSSAASSAASSSAAASSAGSSSSTTGPPIKVPVTTTSSVAASSSSSSSSSAAASASSSGSATISKDQSCGGTNGYTCKGSAYGNCCSAYGWCGSSPAYCGTGCNPKYGTCDPTSETLTNTTVGLCGPSYNATCLYYGTKTCCSKYGYCGNTAAYCGAGCQPKYGTCTA